MSDMKDVKQYLPSKHFRAVAFSILAAGGLIVLASYVPAKASPSDSDLLEKQLAMLAATTTTSITITDQDSDNDGLKDWEEVLWKTDPKKSDTDEDKTLDGEEVHLGRDPSKKGPNDKFVAQIAFSSDKSSPNSVATTTDKVARDLFLKYLESKKSGVAMDKNFEQQIVSVALTKNTSNSRPRLYTISEVTISEDSSEKALRNYANKMGEIINSYNVPQQNEMILTNNALQTEDPKMLEGLDPIIASYSGILNDSLKLSVPSEILSIHLQFLNAISEILYSIGGMRISYIDPVEALNRSKDYLNFVQNLSETMRRISDFYSSRSIKFSETENANSFVLKIN